MCLINLSINAQTGFSINTPPVILLNNQNTYYNCAPIDFGTTTSNTLTFDYTLNRSSDSPYGRGTLIVVIQYDASSEYPVGNAKEIYDTDWFPNSTSGSISCTISAGQLQTTGSKIFLKFVANSGYTAVSCLTPISKNGVTPPPNPTPTPVQAPEFSLSPITVNFPCVSPSPVTFVTTNVHNTSGNITYYWVANGWIKDGNVINGGFITS